MPTSAELAQQITDLDARAAELAQQQQAAQQARAQLAAGTRTAQDVTQVQTTADVLTQTLADLRTQRAALVEQINTAQADEATDAQAARYAGYADEANAAYADVLQEFEQFEQYMQERTPLLWDAFQRLNTTRDQAKQHLSRMDEAEQAEIKHRAAERADLRVLHGKAAPLDQGRAFAHMLLGWLTTRQQQAFSERQAQWTRQRYERERQAEEANARRIAELQRIMAERQAEMAQAKAEEEAKERAYQAQHAAEFGITYGR